MQNKKLQYISRNSGFKDWSKNEKLIFLAYSSEINLKKDDILFSAGQPAQQFFLLITGSIDISNPTGEAVAEFIEGEFFGEFEFMTHAKYNAIASATEPSTLIAFPQNGKTFDDFARDYPHLYAKLLRNFLIVVSQRTRNAGTLLKENSPVTKQLKKQLYGDKLTGVYNKTYVEENLKELFTADMALVMFKPDNFKAINDTFGHEAGDQVLIIIGKILKQELPREAKIIRYEGNAFAVVEQNHTAETAEKLAKKIQTTLEAADLNSTLFKDKKSNTPFTLSISCGIKLFTGEEKDIQKCISECAGLPIKARAAGGHGILFVPNDAD